MPKIKCAVIGVGYLGKYHAEKYASLPNAELVGVCDTDAATGQALAQQYNTHYVSDYHELLGKVDAVSIAAPTRLHHQIAKTFLEHKVHVLVEKPITTTVEEADELIKIADDQGVILQVGHLERFNCVINALNDYLDNPRFIECIRLAPFKLRGTDVNVVLDLMIHDIDLIQFLVKSPIKRIDASGACVLSDQIDIANARIQFENHCVANVTASRVSPQQERRLRLFQPNNYISLDLHHKKLKLNRKGSNEMYPGIPEIISEEQAFKQSDALRDQVISFLNAITHKFKPAVTGEDGKLALATAIEITNIVKQQICLTNLEI